MPKRSRRHPGIVLIKPDTKRRIGWRARWTDPEDGKTIKKVTIPERNARTLESREAWAAQKSRELAKRRQAIDDGAPRATGTTLADAIRSFQDANKRLRKPTLLGYRYAAAKLVAWAATVKVRTLDDISKRLLSELRVAIVNAPLHNPGTRVVVDGRRSAHSINSELRALRTMFGFWFDGEKLPHIGEGHLRKYLKRLPVPRERIVFLESADIVATIRAALAHDAAVYPSKVQFGRRSGTPRYAAVAPFVVAVLLTGMRFSEAINLRWEDVHLDAPDSTGAPVGEIRLAGAGTKTSRARVIDLAVSPALRAMLAGMRGDTATGRVFAPLNAVAARRAALRMREAFGAPATFDYQTLRRTCDTFLVNAPGIFGGASAYRAARQLGHSVQVAESSYQGLVRGIPATAASLERAMGVEAELAQLHLSGP